MGDYAQYLMHARAILEGRPYADIGYLVHAEVPDIGPRAYPPGFPLALVLVIALFGSNLPALRAFMVATALLFAWTAWRRMASDLGPAPSAVGVAFALLAIETQGGTVAPTSDLLFGAILWSLFLLADTGQRWSWGRTALVTMAGFALVAVRLAGAAIGPAMLIFGLVNWRKYGTRPLLVVLVWAVAASAAMLIVDSPYSGVIDRDLSDPARKLYFFLEAYRYSLFEAELYPFGSRWPDRAYHAVATVLVLLGAALIVRRMRGSLMLFFLLSYAVLLLAVRLAAGRFLWPVQPLVGAALFLGLSTVVERWRRVDRPGLLPLPSRLPLVVVSAIVVFSLIRALGARPPFAIAGTPDGDALHAFLRRESAQEPVRAIFHNPRALTLYSGVPAMGVLDRTTAGQLVAMDAERITHLVWQNGASWCLQQILNAVPGRFPERFDLVFSNATFQVYRLRRAAVPSTAPYSRIDWQHPPPNCHAT